MDITIFKQFDGELEKFLTEEIDKILQRAKGKEQCAIAFITTDDFYGSYVAWEYTNNLDDYCDWENSFEPDFLYQPLVDLVDSCEDIDLCNPCSQKWGFAEALISVFDKNIKNLPDEVFKKNGFHREDILFFLTMSQGDYVKEMKDASLKKFNNSKTLKMYGVIQ